MIEFVGSKEQIGLVNIYANEAYDAWHTVRSHRGKFKRRPYHQESLCHVIAPILKNNLVDAGFNAKMLVHDLTLHVHHFVGLDGEWIADPTWQQFLLFYGIRRHWVKDLLAPYPKVLILPKSEVSDFLSKAGLKEHPQVADIYLNSRVNNLW